jgi:hypothetical protein
MRYRRVTRRELLAGGAAGALGAALVPAFVEAAGPQPHIGSPAPAKSGLLKNAGCGCYTDASVAQQLSTFQVCPSGIVCGVGTVANGQNSGPFAMLMYAAHIETYLVDTRISQIRATGRMRSITRAGGQTIEDVLHNFLAVAQANIGNGPGRWDLHFQTPFWNRSNPLATPSELVDPWIRFGGVLVMGEINVSV